MKFKFLINQAFDTTIAMPTSSSASFASFGPPNEVVELTELAPQELESNEVRLKMLYAPINPADINYIQGIYGINLSCLPSPASRAAAKSSRAALINSKPETLSSPSSRWAPGPSKSSAQLTMCSRSQAIHLSNKPPCSRSTH